MKKIIALGIVFALFTATSFAQRGKDVREKQRIHRGFETGQLTRGEKMELRKNDIRYKRTEHRFKRDGRLSKMEKRKLYKMKKYDRKQTFRYKHNGRKRVL